MPSMYKVSKMMSHAVIIGLLIVVLVMLMKQNKSSGYEPSPLTIKPTGNVTSGPQSIFDIRPDIKCTPGPSENSSYYSNGLTPGGLCGDGDFVRGQMRDFDIENGIGGSLLEK